jgi:hypothetical protein
MFTVVGPAATAPGHCSPSRKVVSKITIRLLFIFFKRQQSLLISIFGRQSPEKQKPRHLSVAGFLEDRFLKQITQ